LSYDRMAIFLLARDWRITPACSTKWQSVHNRLSFLNGFSSGVAPHILHRFTIGLSF